MLFCITCFQREKLDILQEKWKDSIRNAIARDLECIRAQHNCLKSYRNVNIYPYLRVLTTEQYVDIIIQEVRKLAEGSETFSPTMLFLYRNLGNQVKLRYFIYLNHVFFFHLFIIRNYVKLQVSN